MRIHPTYTSGDWVDGTVIIGGIRQYYAGVLGRMSQLALAYYSHEMSNASRIKPYENTLHVHEA